MSNSLTAATGLGTMTSAPATRQVGAQANQTAMNQFLTLLTSELKNQDPTQPTDPTQFVAQLAQMSNVQELSQANTTLTSIASAIGGLALGQYTALINHTVSAAATSVTVPASGAVSTPLNFTVTNTTLQNPRVAITNATGNVVAMLPVSGAAGTVTFNGTDQSGAKLPAGQYSVNLIGTPAGGGAGVSASAGNLSTSGVVNGVVQSNTGTWNLQLRNGLIVPASSLTSSS